MENHISRKEENQFHLCENCTNEIELMKREGKEEKSFTKGPYRFRIYSRRETFVVEVASSNEDAFHQYLGTSFSTLDECHQAIQAWVSSPMRMTGSFVSVV